MHYGAYAFSASGKQTIFPLQNKAYAMRVMGQRDGFSEIDLNKINKLYNCPVVGSLHGEQLIKLACF